MESTSPPVAAMQLPRDPAGPLPIPPPSGILLMTAGHRQHAVATADRLRKTIAEDATSSQLMERAGLLTADSDRPAVRIKLECYHALEAKIADARPKLAELEEQFRHREVAASAETPNPRRKVPKAVFDALMYMEMR